MTAGNWAKTVNYTRCWRRRWLI